MKLTQKEIQAIKNATELLYIQVMLARENNKYDKMRKKPQKTKDGYIVYL